MPKDPDGNVKKYLYTQNREISWLRFNSRVLEEAADETVPLLERLKFISIFTSNLDEFFMVRVGSLFDLSLVSPDEIDNKTGMTPAEQLEKIYRMIPGMIVRRDQLYRIVSEKLEQAGICDVNMNSVDAAEKRYIQQYFRAKILPILSPQIVDSHHPFPHLINKALYIAALLHDKKENISLGLIPVPASLPPFLMLPGEKGRYIRMETLIKNYASELFGSFRTEDLCVLSVTRNADISFDEDKFDDIEGDFRTHMSELLKRGTGFRSSAWN